MDFRQISEAQRQAQEIHDFLEHHHSFLLGKLVQQIERQPAVEPPYVLHLICQLYRNSTPPAA